MTKEDMAHTVWVHKTLLEGIKRHEKEEKIRSKYQRKGIGGLFPTLKDNSLRKEITDEEY